MSLFVVEITTRSGEWESTSKQIVTATSNEEAQEIAIQGECHSDAEALVWADGGVYDRSGELFHRVRRVVKVCPEHVGVLKQYF